MVDAERGRALIQALTDIRHNLTDLGKPRG